MIVLPCLLAFFLGFVLGVLWRRNHHGRHYV